MTGTALSRTEAVCAAADMNTDSKVPLGLQAMPAAARLPMRNSYDPKHLGSSDYASCDDNQLNSDRPNDMSLSMRNDSLSSNFSFLADPCRSDLSEGLIQGPVEYQSPEKAAPMFNVNTSFQRATTDSIAPRRSVSLPRTGMSDTIQEYSSLEGTDEESIPSELNMHLSNSNLEATLPVTSLLNVQSTTNRSKVTGEHQPVQRQESNAEPEKIIFSGSKDGRNSISLMLSTCAESTENTASLDTHVAGPRSPRSPRRSRLLTEKRKQQLKQQDNVVRNSPDLNQRPSKSSQNRHLETTHETFRTTSPDGYCVDEFSSLNSNEGNEQVFSDSEAQKAPPRLHVPSTVAPNRDVYSPSSDSSPDPSSLDGKQRSGRRHRVVQREDADPGKGHSKILLCSGSITPRDYKDIQHFQALHSLVKVRDPVLLHFYTSNSY